MSKQLIALYLNEFEGVGPGQRINENFFCSFCPLYEEDINYDEFSLCEGMYCDETEEKFAEFFEGF